MTGYLLQATRGDKIVNAQRREPSWLRSVPSQGHLSGERELSGVGDLVWRYQNWKAFVVWVPYKHSLKRGFR